MTDLLQQPTGVHVDLDGRSLTIEEAVRFARGGGRAVLSAEAARRVEAARALKGDLIAREIPIYGVTTGFGDSAHRQIAPEKAGRLQQNMLRFLGAGTGQIASPEVTRLTMLFRANCLAKGNSGVRMELIERLLTLLNHDILPLIPERGSCGASGDLVPLSYVGRALAGETEVLHEGAVRDAAEDNVPLDGAGFRELERSVQDKYSIRCAPHITGALRDTLEWVEKWVSIEINSSDDNPLFDAGLGRAQSGGNFYGSHITQAMDSLKVALANMADL